MDIERIQDLCRKDRFELTAHAILRFQQRGIASVEIQESILGGEIIEEYPDDFPYPSCLICGKTKQGKVLHSVVGLSETDLWLITAYVPDSNQWDESFRVRKETDV